MANPGRRSSMASGFPLSIALLPCRGVPSQPQQFAIPQFMSQGRHESLEGDGEIGVDSYTIHFVEARVQLLGESTCVLGRTMDA
jgi:hypothetical protein